MTEARKKAIRTLDRVAVKLHTVTRPCKKPARTPIRKNPGFSSGPLEVYLKGTGAPAEWRRVESLEMASRAVRGYIEEYNLGASEWFGGRLMNNRGKVGRVSYNGRVWDEQGKEIVLRGPSRNPGEEPATIPPHAATPSRIFHLPKHLRTEPPSQRPEGTALAVWTWETVDVRGTTYHGAVFHGKGNKPIWHYIFASDAARQSYIDATAEKYRYAGEVKAKRAAERLGFQHGLKPGDIFVTSWGYDQTNVDFYEVVEVKGATVVIREVAKRVAGAGGSSEQVTPVRGKYVGDPMLKRPTAGYKGQVAIKISKGRGHAALWDGKPEHQTAYGWGH